ncbi:hypothetical protein H4217_007905, partial [Coemansia sp. RSA 1939]
TWSDIDDASATEDDSTVRKKKRILRYGRKRLSEMRERFNSSKEKLVEERRHQLDLEWEQLQDGSHPQYKEYAQQIDARWLDRLAKIEYKAELDRGFSKTKHEASCKTALNSFIIQRRELRQGLILGRKKQLWALTDSLRSLEKIREAINNITCPISNQGATGVPVATTRAAPRNSSHMLVIPDTELATVDKDADVSAICGIPALLNQPDSEYPSVEDGDAPSELPVATVVDHEVADTQVPESLGRSSRQIHVAEYGGYHDHEPTGPTGIQGLGIGGTPSHQDYYYHQQQQQQQQQQQHAYPDRSSQGVTDHHARYATASNLPTIAEAPSSGDDGYSYGYYTNAAYQLQHHSQYYGAEDQAVADDYYGYKSQTNGYETDSHRARQFAASEVAPSAVNSVSGLARPKSTVAAGPGYQQTPEPHQSARVSQLVHHPAAEIESSSRASTKPTAGAYAYDPRSNSTVGAYYDHQGRLSSSSSSGHVTKREIGAIDYEDSLNKRQRVMQQQQQPAEWRQTPSSHVYHQQAQQQGAGEYVSGYYSSQQAAGHHDYGRGTTAGYSRAKHAASGGYSHAAAEADVSGGPGAYHYSSGMYGSSSNNQGMQQPTAGYFGSTKYDYAYSGDTASSGAAATVNGSSKYYQQLQAEDMSSAEVARTSHQPTQYHGRDTGSSSNSAYYQAPAGYYQHDQRTAQHSQYYGQNAPVAGGYAAAEYSGGDGGIGMTVAVASGMSPRQYGSTSISNSGHMQNGAGAPSSSSAGHDRAWGDYYQQHPHQYQQQHGPSSSSSSQHYGGSSSRHPQAAVTGTPMAMQQQTQYAGGGGEYYEQGGYYSSNQPQQKQQPPSRVVAGTPYHHRQAATATAAAATATTGNGGAGNDMYRYQ